MAAVKNSRYWSLRCIQTPSWLLSCGGAGIYIARLGGVFQSCGRFKRQGGEPALKGQDSSPPGARWGTYRYFPIVSLAGLRTTPWIACGPKCIVAGPPKTIVMFELVTEYLISFPPEMQTWSVEVGGSVSKVPLVPFPVARLTVPFT